MSEKYFTLIVEHICLALPPVPYYYRKGCTVKAAERRLGACRTVFTKKPPHGLDKSRGLVYNIYCTNMQV